MVIARWATSLVDGRFGEVGLIMNLLWTASGLAGAVRVICAVLLAGFGVSSCGTVTGTPVAAAGHSSRSVEQASPPTATTASSSPAASATIEPVTGRMDVVLPSGNIACSLDADEPSVRCDIRDKTWTVSPDPTCQLAYGHGLHIDSHGTAGVVCAGDTVFTDNSPVLAYGHGLRAQNIVCVSSESGMRCNSERTGHGFTLARATYSLF
jgi:hypothetical protein